QAAVSVLAPTDAMAHWEVALRLMEKHDPDTRRRADLLRRLASTAFEIDRAASLKYGKSAISLYESLGLLNEAARVHTLLGLIFHFRAEPLFNAALASDHLRRAEAELARDPETIAAADLYSAISANEGHLLNVKETARAARRAMEISDRLGDKFYWIAAAPFYAWTLCISGKLSEGFDLFTEATQAAVR